MAGFNTAISGISAATKSLDVTGNNIANASTTGFKSSRTEFADIYATAAIGSGSSNVAGSGVLVSDIAQDFSGGNVEFTNNNLDLSIDGSGFFQLDDGRGSVTYTRNGSFELDKDGFIVSKSGENLQGYGVDDEGNRLPITDLQVSQKESPPSATSVMGLSFNINEALDASALNVPYDREDSGSVTFSTTVGTFDSLGNEHTIQYDMVEQQAKKELHSYDQTALGVVEISGISIDTNEGDIFDGPGTGTDGVGGSMRASEAANLAAGTPTTYLADLQAADPRIFDVVVTPATGVASPTNPNTVTVIFKAEAFEYGNLIVANPAAAANDLLNETVTSIDSNEVHRFAMTAVSYDEAQQFSVAGVNISISPTATDPLTASQVADVIIAKESQIRDGNPNIDSLTFDSATNELVITFKAESGDVGDGSALVNQTAMPATITQGVFDIVATGPIAAASIVQGDNSFEGVYRMYAYLNPLGQRPVALDIGKLVDPGSSVPTDTEISPIIVKFNPSNGILSAVNGTDVPTGIGAQVPTVTIKNADPALPDGDADNVITLDLTGATQFADEQIVKSQSQDGYGKGDLTGVSFNGNGEMVASFSNSQSQVLGIVAIATFENQAGLQSSGGTQWVATNVSGGAVLNPPGSGLNGSLRSSALESSNVDLSAELVKLIEAQRNFQASSKTLETLNTVTQNILQI